MKIECILYVLLTSLNRKEIYALINKILIKNVAKLLSDVPIAVRVYTDALL